MIQRLQNFQDRAKKSRNLNIFTFLKTRRQCDFFQIDQKDLFFFQKVGNSGKRGLLVRSRQYDLCFSKNMKTFICAYSSAPNREQIRKISDFDELQAVRFDIFIFFDFCGACRFRKISDFDELWAPRLDVFIFF